MIPRLILRSLSLKLRCNILVTCHLLLLFHVLHLGVSWGPSLPEKILTRPMRLSTLIFEHTKEQVNLLLYLYCPHYPILMQFCRYFSAASGLFREAMSVLPAFIHALSCFITKPIRLQGAGCYCFSSFWLEIPIPQVHCVATYC